VRSFAKYEKKDYDGALADFNEGLKLDPNNLMFLSGTADISYSKQKYPEALASYQKALAQDPRNGDLYLSVARTQAQLNNPTGQAAAAEEAIKRNVHALGDAYYLAGDGYLTLHRYPEAEQAFVNAISRWKAVNEKPADMYKAYRSLG